MTCSKKNNKKGILISLIKRATPLKVDFQEKYDYIIFGHYDGMDVKEIENIGDYKPAGVSKLTGSTELDDDIFDKYTIKAVYPPEEVIDKLQNSYGIEYNLCSKTLPIDEEKNFNVAYPFIACTMLHLSKECIAKNEYTEIFDLIAHKIYDVAPSIKFNIYFSLGYSDIVIMMRTQEFDSVNKVLSALNSLKTAESKWISDLYTITGYEKSVFQDDTMIYKKAVEEHDLQEVTYSVSFILQPGFSLCEFKKELIANLRNTFEKISYNYDVSELKNNIWETFGNIDVVANIRVPITLFPILYADIENEDIKGPFNIHSEFFKKYITSIEVSVLCNAIDGISQNLNKYDYQSIPDKYFSFVKDFKEFAEQYNLPKRIVVVVIKILKTYHSLSLPKHGFDLHDIIGSAIDSFITNLNLSMNLIKNATGLNRGKLINNMENSIRKFRGYIETYLSDLFRSDRSFIEGMTMTHPSIGSLTKVLFSYNVFINKLACNLSKGEENYSFVVVSGGCDQTEVDEIFHYIGGWDEQYSHLYVITIPEIGLLDICGTLFRLSHECLHCFGDRKRRIRAKKALYAWAEYIAKIISESVFNINFYNTDDILLTDNAINTINNKQSEFYLHFKNTLFHIIDEDFFTEQEGNEEDFYAINCVDKLNHFMGMNFVLGKECISDFYMEMYPYILDGHIEILKYLLSEMNLEINALGTWSDLLCELEYYKNNDVLPNEMESVPLTLFNRLFNSILAPNQVICEQILYQSVEKISDEQMVSEEQCNMNSGILANLIDIMCECFSDCMSAKILNISLESFLISFVYETWEIEKSMPKNFNNIFRLAIDLHVLFGISGKLTQENKDAVTRAKEQYITAGYDLKMDLDTYFDRIDSLLLEYEQYKQIGEQIISYLNECDLNNCGLEKSDKLWFQKIYNKFANPTKVNTEDIYDFLELWKGIAQGNSYV